MGGYWTGTSDDADRSCGDVRRFLWFLMEIKGWGELLFPTGQVKGPSAGKATLVSYQYRRPFFYIDRQ